MIDRGITDRTGRRTTLRAIDDDNWRAVADIAPLDDQRDHVPALAARYLLLSSREDTWHSLAVYADDVVTGHVMWARDEDGSYWIGGMLIDAPEQGRGIGRAVLRTLTAWLAEQDGCEVIRLSYEPGNVVAGRLYTSMGFRPTDASEDDEVVVELPVDRAAIENPESADPREPHDRRITDGTLGVFVRGSCESSDGTRLDDPFYSRTCELGGRQVSLMLDTVDPSEARALLPRLRRAVEHAAGLRRRAVEAVLHRFSEDPPTPEEMTEAQDDLTLETVAIGCDGVVVLHLTDSCGEHVMDGYWPAVRFDDEDRVVDVTMEA